MKRILLKKSSCTLPNQLFTKVFYFVFQSISQKLASASLILIFLLHCCIGQAQNNLWVVGDKLVDFNNSNLITTPVLPQPTVATALQPYVYSGQVANNNQYAEYDQNGNLLFFVIDGNIYDHEGFMIADADSVNCEICFPDNAHTTVSGIRTTNNLVVTKVPGQCDKYYLIVNANIAILDLSLPNHFFPNNEERMGGLLPINYILQNTETYGDIDFTAFFAQNFPPGFDILGVNYYHVQLPFKSDAGHAINAIYQDIYDDNINGTKYLGISADGYITQYELRSNGAFYLNNESIPGIDGEGLPIYGSLEYSKYNGQKMAANSISAGGSINFQESSLFVTNLNSNMSFSITNTYNPHTEGISGVTGDIEFSENGKYLFYTINVAPYLGVVDIQNNTVTELADLVAIANPSDYINGRMEMNYYQQVPSIFFITSSGLSILKGCNDMSTATFIANGIPINPISDNNFAISPFSGMYLLPKQPYKHAQIPSMSNAICCQYYIEGDAYQGHTVGVGTTTWSYGAGNNPWNATGPVYLMGDLVFNAGANITINGMEFRFGPEADVVINVGAFVKLNSNSKWTSYECNGLMWPGVNLMGNPSQAQSSSDNAWSQQGILLINNSTIENARIGVEVGMSNSTGGGVLKGYTATFVNCQNGVKYQPYSGIQQGVWYTSRWIINAQLKDPTAFPGRMVHMINMKGNIGFNGCSFVNSTPYMIYLMPNRGTGILAINSRFSLSGGSGSYDGHGDNTHTTFYKWRIGIKAINGGTTSFSVQSMYFQECNIGLSANAVNNESIVQNVFTIPSNAYVFAEKPRGVILTGCTGFTFRENDFAGISSNLNINTTAQNVGAMLVNCGGADNLGYRNDFINLWKGEEVQGNNRNGEAMTGLQLRCNIYNNIRFDQYLASNAEWRHNQGEASDMINLANNKFSISIPDCNTSRYDMYVDPVHFAGYSFDYIRPDNEFHASNSQESWDGADCLSPHMQDFCPLGYNDVPFNYNNHCPVIPPTGYTGVGGSIGMAEHSIAVQNLEAARALYQLVVDANQKTDIEAEINKAFPMESSQMRDYLLSRSPLSDHIMKETIDKIGLLDSWHLTQILLANGPLTKDVLYHLESSDVLNNFFMSFIYEAQITGVINYRKLLENEISTRESERHNALAALLDLYNQNADQVDHTDDIRNLMLADGSIEAKIWLLEYHISEGNQIEAEALIDEMETWNAMSDYTSLKTMQLALNNDWTQANPSQLADIELWAINSQSSAYGSAISVLHSLEVSEVLPEPEMPFEDRSAFSLDLLKPDVHLPDLSAYPNPATDHTFITYPAEADVIGKLEVYDSMGQLVSSNILNGKGIIEIDTKRLVTGVYLLSIVVEGQSILNSKLIIID